MQLHSKAKWDEPQEHMNIRVFLKGLLHWKLPLYHFMVNGFRDKLKRWGEGSKDCRTGGGENGRTTTCCPDDTSTWCHWTGSCSTRQACFSTWLPSTAVSSPALQYARLPGNSKHMLKSGLKEQESSLQGSLWCGGTLERVKGRVCWIWKSMSVSKAEEELGWCKFSSEGLWLEHSQSSCQDQGRFGQEEEPCSFSKRNHGEDPAKFRRRRRFRRRVDFVKL